MADRQADGEGSKPIKRANGRFQFAIQVNGARRYLPETASIAREKMRAWLRSPEAADPAKLDASSPGDTRGRDGHPVGTPGWDAGLPMTAAALPLIRINRSVPTPAEDGFATFHRLTKDAMTEADQLSSDRSKRGPGAVSQRLAAAAAGVRFRRMPGSSRLAVGVADGRIRIAFEVEDDAEIDDIQRLLQGLVDEVQAMSMCDTPDRQGN